LGSPHALSSLNSIEAVDSSQGRPVRRMDGARCGPLPIERSLSRALQPAHSEVPPVVVRNERRPSAGLGGHRVRESGRTGVRASVADSARTRRRSSEDRCLDVVRTGRQRAARERRQAIRGPGTIVTALRETRCDRECRNARMSAPGVVAGLAPRAYRVMPGRPLL
jgi:hypothetical protein